MTRTLRSVVVPAAILVVLAGPAAARVLYSSQFAPLPPGPADLPGWSLRGADYRLADGWLTVTSERSNPEALLDLRHEGDFTFRATVRGAGGVHWCSLLARGVYRLEVNNQFQRVALLRRAGEDWQVVAQASPYQRFVASSAAFELRLVARGTHLSAFLDARRVLDYEDAQAVPPGGAYGLLSGWGTKLAWRDIRLSDTPDETEARREALPEPGGRRLLEVTSVRGLGQQEPFDNIYFDRETAGLRLRLRPQPQAPSRLLLRFRLIDVRQQQQAVQTKTLETAGAAEQALEVRFVPPARGCFKVALDAGADERDLQWVEDLGSFTVVSPELQRRPRPAGSFFGGHMDGIHLDWHLRTARKLGITWARCHDTMQWTWWDRVQPDGPEQWRWADDCQRTVDDLGFATSGEFLWVPRWAQSRSAPAGRNPASYPPDDLTAFGRYVYETVSHYRGSIHSWEVWNEPHYHGFFSGTPEQYARMLEVASREARRADPQCQVVGGGGVNLGSLGWIEQMLAAGAARNMDVFSLHYLDPDLAGEQMAALRDLLRRSGFNGPIYNSEETVESTSFLDQCRTEVAEPEARYHFRNACYELVRVYMENLSHGVDRVFFYTLADPWRFKAYPKPRVAEHSVVSGLMWDEGQMLKPVAAAHAALALAIDGKRFNRRLSKGEAQVFIFGTPGGRSAAAVQYALYPSYTQQTKLRLRLPQGVDSKAVRFMDFMGNERGATWQQGEAEVPLGREPVYVLCEGAGAAATLEMMYAQSGVAP